MPLPPRSARIAAALFLSLGVLVAPTPAAPPSSPTVASAPQTRDARPLGPVASADPEPAGGNGAPPRGLSTVRTAASLAAVLAVIFGGAALFKRLVLKNPTLAASLGAGGRAPAGILEIIGRYPVGRGASLVLLRLDKRILLLSQTSAPGGRGLVRPGAASLATLCEITAADDVASILAKARDDDGDSLAARFQSLLSGINDESDDATGAPAPDDQPAPPAVVVRTSTWPVARGGAA